MKRNFVRLSALGLVLLMLPLGVASGQAALPVENHYAVYEANEDTYSTLYRPLRLVDQFGSIDVDGFYLGAWANPVTKIHDGVTYAPVDPMVHQTWWILPYLPTPERTVIGIDQFGYGPVKLGSPIALVNPALKNPLPPYGGPPSWNHYLCYQVIFAQQLQIHVTLYDQWGTSQVVLLRKKLFCNPVEKIDLATGKVDPILDPTAHLQCYVIDGAPSSFHPIVGVDQFGIWQIEAYQNQNECLCVPARKEHIVGTEQSTWGQIKALYR